MTAAPKKYGPTWRIRWDAGIKPDGSRRQLSEGGFKTKREAELALRERLDEVERGMALDSRKMRVEDYLAQWLESKRSIRSSTRRAYEGHVRVHLNPHIGKIPLRSLRAEHLDSMYSAIRTSDRPPSVATMRRIHATLRGALNTAFKRRLIPFNPANQVELPPEPLAERAVWSFAEVDAFLTLAKRDRLGAAYHLLATTGMRRGECCGLSWSDVDLEAGTVTVRRQLTQSGKAREFGEPKTRRGARTISLDAETVGVLRTHRAGQAAERLAWGSAYESQDLVFCKEDGAPVSPELVSRRFIALGAEAGLPRIVLHGLRHSYATNALASGEEVVIVSKRLGHSRSHFTADNYMRQTDAADRQAAERMAARVREAGQRRATGEAP